MDITNFQRVSLGSEFPACVIVQPIEGHEAYGIMSYFYLCGLNGEYHQLRIHNTDKIAAMFSFKSKYVKIPEYWEDSTIVWDSRS